MVKAPCPASTRLPLGRARNALSDDPTLRLLRLLAGKCRFAFLALVAAASAGCGSPTRPGPPSNPPRISCPADISIRGAIGPLQPVCFDTPAAGAGTLPVAVTCAPPSGSAFPIGTTPVRCTATDASAREATCTFNVTLTGVQIAVTHYLAFGDSVTEGQNGRIAFGLEIVDVPNAYPTKLQFLLEGAYPNEGIVVSTRAVGGEVITDGKARLPDVLAHEHPAALLLLHGYNNLLADCQNPVTSRCSTQVETVVETLRDMVRIARRPPFSLKYVFVGTLTPPGPFRGGSRDRRIADEAITKTNAGIRQKLPGEGATVVDIYPLFLGHESEYIAPDGLHPDPAGNDAIAGAFFDAIKAAIPQNPLLALAAALRH